jgi:phenylacetate-CoA ligase
VCEKRNEYHIFPEYGITEIIRPDGKQVTREGELGEIIGTGFYNYAMPFIRYKTSDIAVWTNEKCDCGREYSLLKRIEGRLQDFVVSQKGHLIPMTTIPYSFVNNVKQFQFYQDTPGEVTLRVVRMSTYTKKDSEYILGILSEEMGESIEFCIEFVDNIERTKGEKYMYLIQKLPVEFGNISGEMKHG